MTALETGDPRTVGDYELLERLGAGGMGQVYLGRSPSGRKVAVKVVHAELVREPQFRARFRQEIQAARLVSGAFTAPVIDADPDAPRPWLVTSYIAGPTLHQAVVDEGPRPPATVRVLAAGLAEALVSIHRANLVHRDLKPSNVLLAEDGPRVIDFGIVRVLETGTITRTGTVAGSPGFMSPEQCTGAPVTAASDVFSLGAVLAFAATGSNPFGDGLTPALLYRVVHTEPELAAVPDPALRALIADCLAKDPARRPTPREILARTRHVATSPPPPPPTAPPGTGFGPPPTRLDGVPDQTTTFQPPARHSTRRTFLLSALGTAAVAAVPATLYLQGLDNDSSERSRPEPIAFWPLDETARNEDEATGDHPSSAVGVRWEKSVAGAQFDGVGSWIHTAEPVIDTGQLSSFTVSVFVNLSRIPQRPACAASQDGLEAATFSVFRLGYLNEEKGWFASHGVTQAFGTRQPRAGDWVHLAATYDAAGQQLTVYVDGHPGAPVLDQTLRTDSGAFVIGRAQAQGVPDQFFPGSISGVRVFDHSLTEQQITQMAR